MDCKNTGKRRTNAKGKKGTEKRRLQNSGTKPAGKETGCKSPPLVTDQCAARAPNATAEGNSRDSRLAFSTLRQTYVDSVPGTSATAAADHTYTSIDSVSDSSGVKPSATRDLLDVLSTSSSRSLRKLSGQISKWRRLRDDALILMYHLVMVVLFGDELRDEGGHLRRSRDRTAREKTHRTWIIRSIMALINLEDFPKTPGGLSRLSNAYASKVHVLFTRRGKVTVKSAHSRLSAVVPTFKVYNYKVPDAFISQVGWRSQAKLCQTAKLETKGYRLYDQVM